MVAGSKNWGDKKWSGEQNLEQEGPASTVGRGTAFTFPRPSACVSGLLNGGRGARRRGGSRRNRWIRWSRINGGGGGNGQCISESLTLH